MAFMQPAEVKSVRVPVEWAEFQATLHTPDKATQVVLLLDDGAQVNRRLAGALERNGMGALLLNLFTEQEIGMPQIAFDLHLLAHRINRAAARLKSHPLTRQYRFGILGTGLTSTVAVMAAASDSLLHAIVSVNGRPDLALFSLGRVKAPTLLIAAENDALVARLNRQAYSELRCEKELRVIPYVGAPWQNPRILDEVAAVASSWFQQHL